MRRDRISKDAAEEYLGVYDAKDRPWCYNIEVNYDEIDDIEKRNEYLFKRKEFLEQVMKDGL